MHLQHPRILKRMLVLESRGKVNLMDLNVLHFQDMS